MNELKELIDALMEEQRDLLEQMRQLDPLCDDYKKLQLSIAKNAEIIADLNKRIRDEDYEKLEHDIQMKDVETKEKELKWKPFYEGLNIGGGIAKILVSGAVTAFTIKLIYAAEQDSLMPGNKVSLATKFLLGPKC